MSSGLKLDFIGVGPQKTGSTWLDEMLRTHEKVCLPNATKETQFFDDYYDETFKGYAQYFEDAKQGQLVGEVCPSYFDVEDVPARIKHHFPDVKIIFTLRHPVSRTESLFRHHLRKGRVSSVFSEAAVQMPRIVSSGEYKRHLELWIEVFGMDKLHFILLDDIASNPQEVLQRLSDFLGLENQYNEAQSEEQVNKAGMPKFPLLAKLAAKMVLFLKKYRLHKIVELGKSLGFKKVYDGGKDLPSMTSEEKLGMSDHYKADVEFVEEILDRKLAKWNEV